MADEDAQAAVGELVLFRQMEQAFRRAQASKDDFTVIRSELIRMVILESEWTKKPRFAMFLESEYPRIFAEEAAHVINRVAIFMDCVVIEKDYLPEAMSHRWKFTIWEGDWLTSDRSGGSIWYQVGYGKSYYVSDHVMRYGRLDGVQKERIQMAARALFELWLEAEENALVAYLPGMYRGNRWRRR